MIHKVEGEMVDLDGEMDMGRHAEALWSLQGGRISGVEHPQYEMSGLVDSRLIARDSYK